MSKFRTTEISDPQFPLAGLQFITVKTNHLKGRGDICIYAPEGQAYQDLPIVILLHGVYGSAWVWALKGGAHITAQKLIKKREVKPFVLAMPSDGLWGDGSGYLPHHSLDFEKWICEDIPNAVIENIEACSTKSPLFINGLSMGGYGALRIGSKYPEKFKAVSGHSAITSLPEMSLFVEEPLSDYHQADPINEDIFKQMYLHKDRLPPFRFDCGKDDLLIEYNRKLSSKLKEAEIPHIYEEFEGAHEWVYWQKYLVNALKFFNEYM